MDIKIKKSMKKIIIVLAIIFSCTSFTTFQNYVYICKGPYSKVYHKSDHCKGLSNCSTEVYSITIQDAEQMNRRPCRIEY